MWTYDGTFPGPTIRRPAGERTEVTFKHRLPAEAGELTVHLHGGHNRSEYDGQPGGLTHSHPRSLLLPDPAGAAGQGVGQRPADRARLREDLRLRPDRGRAARARRLPVVPRPSPRPHRPQRLARPGGDVDPRRRARRLARRCRTASCDVPLMIVDRSFDRHNQLLDPFSERPPPARRRHHRQPRPRQRRPPAPPPGRTLAATACGSSTPRSSAPTTCSSPTAPTSSRSPPTAA